MTEMGDDTVKDEVQAAIYQEWNEVVTALLFIVITAGIFCLGGAALGALITWLAIK